MDNSNYIENNISIINITEEKTHRVTPIVDNKDSQQQCSKNDYSNYETRINMPTGPLTSIYHELIPYPTSLISTIIENADEHNMNRSTINKARKERLISTKKRKQLFNQTSQSSLETDRESIASQQDNNNIINDSQICFDKFDISQIVKRLQEKIDSSTQTNVNEKCNQFTQVNFSNGGDETTAVRAEQQRTNQSLRNQIQQLNYIIEEMSKERSNHNIYVHGLQKQLNDKEIKIKKYDDDNKKLLADKEELIMAVKNSEIKLSNFQQEALLIRKENESLKLKQNQFSMTPDLSNLMNQKDTTINELNNHILAYQQENIRLNSNIRFLNERLQTMEKSDKNVDAINNKVQAKQILINNRLKIFKSDCSKLRQQLNELKVHFKKTLGDIVRDNADNITEEIMPLISSLLAPPKNCRNCNELILEMNKLKQFNQQLLQENMQKNNDAYFFEQLRCENEKLKVHNVKLKDDVQSMNETLNELQIEYETSQLRINQCNSTIRQLQNESRNNPDMELLQSENGELREQIESLKRSNSVIKEKYEQICRELNINGNDRATNLPQIQNDLSTESSTTDNSIQEGSQATLAEEMQQLIYQKNSQIQEQNSNIQDLKSQVEELRTMVSEYENGQNITSKIIEENELQIQQLNSVILNQTNQIDQRIMMLENELAQERNRSKSLSLTLANEKSANARLETEFFRLQQEYFKGPRANVIYEDSNHESEDDTIKNNIQTLKQELLTRISRLKELLNINNNASAAPAPNDDNNFSSNNDNSTSLSDNAQTLSSNELLIQFLLDQTEHLEQMNEQTPLIQIHSSVEDLRNEFNNLKQILRPNDS